jgi:hypothetical protein
MRVFAFLNVAKPWVAWLVYRGEMVSAQASDTQAVSVWHAYYLTAPASPAAERWRSSDKRAEP